MTYPMYEPIVGKRKRKQMMQRMRRDGMPDTHIAAHFKISKARVGQILGAKVPRGPRKKPNGQAAGG